MGSDGVQGQTPAAGAVCPDHPPAGPLGAPAVAPPLGPGHGRAHDPVQRNFPSPCPAGWPN